VDVLVAFADCEKAFAGVNVDDVSEEREKRPGYSGGFSSKKREQG